MYHTFYVPKTKFQLYPETDIDFSIDPQFLQSLNFDNFKSISRSLLTKLSDFCIGDQWEKLHFLSDKTEILCLCIP